MNLLQRHDEWVADRVGKITASRVSGITAKPKKGKALNATMTKLLTERLTGEIEDRRISDACLLYTSPSPRDRQKSRMPSSA